MRARRALRQALSPLQLASIASEPVIKVSLLCGAGALCSKQGILTLQGRRMLSSLIMNVFTPALLLSKLSSVDARQALELWPLAANMVAVHVVGLGLGWAQVALLDVPASLRSKMMAMPALGNIGNLPLVMVPTLLACPDVAALCGGASGSSSQGRGLTLVMLGFFVASFIQFPIGYTLLQKPPDVAAGAAAAGEAAAAEAAVSAVSSGTSSVSSGGSPGALAVANAGVAASAAELPATSADLQQALSVPAASVHPLQQQQQQQSDRWSALLKGVITPPVIACLLAIPIGSIPILHDELFSPAGSISVLGDAISMLGAPLIPCLFLVLGANLAEGPGAAQVSPKLLAAMIITKLVLHPLAGMGLVLLALHAQLLPATTEPLVPLVMMMVWASPTAVLVHSLATMLQNGEDQVSVFLFWQYLASLVTLPAFLALYLELLQNGQLSVR